MKILFFICLLFSKISFGSEIQGEWSRCIINKESIVLYTSIFTKNYRYEISLLGMGKSCNDIYKNANFAAIITSKISQKNNIIIHERISTAFGAFDEEARVIIGSSKTCNLENWFKDFDKSCFLEGGFIPEIEEALLQDIQRKSTSSVRIYKKKEMLFEDVFQKKGLYPSKNYLIKNFE